MSKWNYMSIQGQDHSLTLAQGHSDMKLKLVFLRNHWVICNQISRKAFRNKEVNINKYEFSHMTNMAAMPVYGKII